MTTITIKKNLTLPKTTFKDEKEMILYFIEYTNYDILDFYELEEQELNDDLVAKIELSKKKDISDFDNI